MVWAAVHNQFFTLRHHSGDQRARRFTIVKIAVPPPMVDDHATSSLTNGFQTAFGLSRHRA